MTRSPETVVIAAIADWLKARAPLVVGICASQGAGKSTLCQKLAAHFEGQGRRVAVLSLDDLYLSHAARAKMSVLVHPLFAARGVPGTHDVALGLRVLRGLKHGAPVHLPRFDKRTDDPVAPDLWPEVAAPDLILFEGWCVGVPPQDEADLITPVNALERDEDAQGLWRRTVNAALAGAYTDLWRCIDRQVFLAAPDFATVLRWRTQAEHALRASGARGMTDAQMVRFVQHYERLTRHAIEVMPSRADLSLSLDADRKLRL